MREAEWLAKNRARLSRDYRGLWIAVVGDAVVASGATFGEAYRQLTDRGIADALIEQMPDAPDQWEHLIA